MEKKNRLYAGNSQEIEVLIMQKAEILTDNPQERLQLRSNKLAYLAGFLDADGCFSLFRTQRGNKIYLNPLVVCTNCDFSQMDLIAEMMTFLDFPHYVQERKPAKANHRASKDVRVQGIKRCARVLPQMIPYLIGKKERASLLLMFCELRLKKMGKAEPYSRVEIAIWEEICKQNKRGQTVESSETNTPISLLSKDEDRVRACVRA